MSTYISIHVFMSTSNTCLQCSNMSMMHTSTCLRCLNIHSCLRSSNKSTCRRCSIIHVYDVQIFMFTCLRCSNMSTMHTSTCLQYLNIHSCLRFSNKYMSAMLKYSENIHVYESQIPYTYDPYTSTCLRAANCR